MVKVDTGKEYVAWEIYLGKLIGVRFIRISWHNDRYINGYFYDSKGPHKITFSTNTGKQFRSSYDNYFWLTEHLANKRKFLEAIA